MRNLLSCVVRISCARGFRSFLAHHLAAISAAIVTADAVTLAHAASAMSWKLAMGLMP